MAISSGQRFSIRHPDRFFIGGEWVRPFSVAQFDVITPSTEVLYCRVAEAALADVDRAVAAARLAFDRGPWPQMPYAERAGYLQAMAREVAARADDLGEVWISEVGVISGVAKATVRTVADTYEYYAGLADAFEFQERHTPQAGGNAGFLVREPVGVVGAIVPWNGALGLIAYKIAPALLAGCTVIIKSSPESPGAALMMAEVAQSVGLPPGVINAITADREVSELLVRHPGVDKITFTGSSAAGKKIGAICGERIARCTLELGGKSAALILDDYDLGEAARSICGSAILLSGQVCSSLTRLVVSRHRHDEFVEALSAAFREVKVGDPFAEEIQMGPLAMRRQRERVENYIAKGRNEGATLAAGGSRPRHLDRGFFVEPTVFANVDNNMTIAREEIFGPVVSVIPVADEKAAIEVANDTVFGLNASVFTQDAARAYDVARQLRAGTVGHNSWRTDFSIAFGGFKQSGIGREGGREGLLPFLEVKTIILDDEP